MDLGRSALWDSNQLADGQMSLVVSWIPGCEARACQSIHGTTLVSQIPVVLGHLRRATNSSFVSQVWPLWENTLNVLCSALVELYLEGGEEAQDAAWAALLAAEAFCRPNKLAALNELTRRLIDGKHTAKVRPVSLGHSRKACIDELNILCTQTSQ